eukprot:5526564-Amphidinium_carterae.1
MADSDVLIYKSFVRRGLLMKAVGSVCTCLFQFADNKDSLHTPLAYTIASKDQDELGPGCTHGNLGEAPATQSTLQRLRNVGSPGCHNNSFSPEPDVRFLGTYIAKGEYLRRAGLLEKLFSATRAQR